MGVYVRNSARSGELFFVEGGFWADTESLVYQIYFLNVHSSKIIILQSLNETSLPTVVLSPSFRESKKSLEENSALALAAPKTDRKTSPKRLAEMGPEATHNAVMMMETLRRQQDCALSTCGYEQIERLETFLNRGGWSHVVRDADWAVHSSPMKRCLLTATAVQRGLGLDVVVNPTIFETGGCYHKNVCF